MISNQDRDMDAEVTALEGKLSKARQVKQGMMSVLLTGRVRLVRCKITHAIKFLNIFRCLVGMKL